MILFYIFEATFSFHGIWKIGHLQKKVFSSLPVNENLQISETRKKIARKFKTSRKNC